MRTSRTEARVEPGTAIHLRSPSVEAPDWILEFGRYGLVQVLLSLGTADLDRLRDELLKARPLHPQGTVIPPEGGRS